MYTHLQIGNINWIPAKYRSPETCREALIIEVVTYETAHVLKGEMVSQVIKQIQ